jgi:O-antigen/teichoic acid export membrane protein
LLPLYAFGWDRLVIRLLFSGTIDYEKYRYLILVGIVLAVYAQMLLNFFLTKEQISSVQRYNTSRILLGLLLTIGALYAFAGDGATIRMLGYFAAELIALCAFFPAYARAMRGRFSSYMASRSLALGLPIMGSAVLGCVINFGDKFFVERYCTPADMSVYFFGLALAGAVSLVAMSFQNVWLPSFLKETDLAVNLGRTRRVGRYLLLMLTFLSVAIWIAVATGLWFGVFKHEYAGVLELLPIQLAANVATGMGGLFSAYTIYWNMTYVNVMAGVVVAVVSAFLNYFAVKSLGIYGAAWTSLVVNVLFALIYFWFMRHRSIAQRATVNFGAQT